MAKKSKKWSSMTERSIEWEFSEGDPSVWRYPDGTPVDTLPLGDGPEFAAIREDMSLVLYENNDPKGKPVPYVMTEGGSSVSACTGNNEYESTYHHYMKKVGADDAVSEASKEDTFFRGHTEEAPTAEYFKRIMKLEYNTEVELENDTYMYGNQKYPGARVNLDRRIRKIDGKQVNGGLEIKTAGPFSAHADLFKKGILPSAYEDQVRFYMAVMNIDFFYVIGRWGMELMDCAIILVKRDMEIEKHLMDTYMDFYYCVENGIEPAEMSNNSALLIKDYIRLHGAPDTKRPVVELPDSSKTVIEEALSLSALIEKKEEEIKEMKKREQDILMSLLPYLTDEDCGLAAYASCRLDEKTVAGITVKQSCKKDSFNSDLLKANEPELFEEFKKETVDATKLKARAKTLKFSKEHPLFNIQDYIIPGEVDASKAPTFKIKLREKELN